MMGPIKNRIAVTVIGAAVTAALAPAVAQAGTWLNPVPVNLSNGSSPSVALDATGNTVAAWMSNPPPPSASNIQAARHAVGATGFTQLSDFSSDSSLAANSN